MMTFLSSFGRRVVTMRQRIVLFGLDGLRMCDAFLLVEGCISAYVFVLPSLPW